MPAKTAHPKSRQTTAMPELASDAPVNAEPEAAADQPSDPTPGSLPSIEQDGASVDAGKIDDVFKELKNLLSTVEKLQKARQDVGDIKPSLIRLLDGELLDGEELEPLKSGVGSLSKLVKIYGDYQSSLERAQPARELLDMVLK